MKNNNTKIVYKAQEFKNNIDDLKCQAKGIKRRLKLAYADAKALSSAARKLHKNGNTLYYNGKNELARPAYKTLDNDIDLLKQYENFVNVLKSIIDNF